MFDGYGVVYDMSLSKPLTREDIQLTCFGFDQDPNGYFCAGVFGDEFEDDMYSSHGAGYWYWGEELDDYGECVREGVKTEWECTCDSMAEYGLECEDYLEEEAEAVLLQTLGRNRNPVDAGTVDVSQGDEWFNDAINDVETVKEEDAEEEVVQDPEVE